MAFRLAFHPFSKKTKSSSHHFDQLFSRPCTMAKNNKRKLGHTGEIVFDPEARKQYLRGFSERKRQRRAYGLAMQKVKDRNARLEHRQELKKAVMEQVEHAEKQKEELLSEFLKDNVSPLTKVDYEKVKEAESIETKVEMYEDVQTQTQWGGEVVVTTSTRIPGESDDEEEQDSKPKPKKKKADVEQEYAGKVDKYLEQLKSKMPSKKKDRTKKHKGSHGAANMKGMASGGDMKLVQKVLAKSQAKQKGKHGVSHGGPKKHGKKRGR